jgi:hypothetical protein
VTDDIDAMFPEVDEQGRKLSRLVVTRLMANDLFEQFIAYFKKDLEVINVQAVETNVGTFYSVAGWLSMSGAKRAYREWKR